MKPWHRFELLEKLAEPAGSVAQAYALGWSNLKSDWIRTGEIISVHNYNGRHFGLVGEKGWARCEGDSQKPEVVDLGGLIRFGKLDGDLKQGSSAIMDVWNVDVVDNATVESDTGYSISVYDWLLPFGGLVAKGAKVWAQYDCMSERWYLISWAKGPLLGKPQSDISQAPNSGTISVYTGVKGSETASGSTVTAYNRMFGKIRSTEWVWVDSQDGGLSWEIIATEGANEIYGKLTPAGSQTNATFPGNNATVKVYKNGADTGVTIQAMVVHAPILDGEGVHCLWTGEQYSVVSGDFDGGILATYTGTGSAAILTSGGQSTSFKIAPGPGTDPTNAISFMVSNPGAPVLANTKLWLGRNANRFYVVSGQMSSAYGKVDQPSSGGGIHSLSTGADAEIHVYQNGADTGATIMALVEHAPILETEFVSCQWDGLQWIVTSGDYDGGFNAQYAASSDLAKGSSSTSFNINILGGPFSGVVSITCLLGIVPAGKLVRVSRDATGFYVTAAEC